MIQQNIVIIYNKMTTFKKSSRASSKLSKKLSKKARSQLLGPKKEKRVRCAFINSHGAYFDPMRKIQVPDNIRLIQYTNPRNVNFFAVHERIIENGCKNLPDMDIYAISLRNAKIFKYGYKKQVTEPSNKTMDLHLSFNSNEADTNQRIIHPNQTEWKPDGELITTLSAELEKLSAQYKIEYPGKIINVIQLSCRVGKEVTIYDDHNKRFRILNINYGDDIDEFIRDFEALNLETTKLPIYLEKRFHLAYNYEDAKKLSEQVKQTLSSPKVIEQKVSKSPSKKSSEHNDDFVEMDVATPVSSTPISRKKSKSANSNKSMEKWAKSRHMKRVLAKSQRAQNLSHNSTQRKHSKHMQNYLARTKRSRSQFIQHRRTAATRNNSRSSHSNKSV
jgi:hypothetical protein